MSFNRPAENSILATATPEMRAKMRQNRRRFDADARMLEKWASSGFVSGSLDGDSMYNLDE